NARRRAPRAARLGRRFVERCRFRQLVRNRYPAKRARLHSFPPATALRQRNLFRCEPTPPPLESRQSRAAVPVRTVPPRQRTRNRRQAAILFPRAGLNSPSIL